MQIIQPNPAIALEYHYIAETNIVEVTFQLGILAPFVLGLTPEGFFELMNKIGSMTIPFIEGLHKLLEEGVKKDIKAGFDAQAWEKKMEDKNEKAS